MGKFVRDLMVDRERLCLKRVKAWVPIDGTWWGLNLDTPEHRKCGTMSTCMSCGCCWRHVRNSTRRLSDWVGERDPFHQSGLLFNEHPTGKILQDDRMKRSWGSAA